MSDKIRDSRSLQLSFIRDSCIPSSRTLLELNQPWMALALVTLGIEWLGASLENIPTGAKDRSKKRFQLAIDKCFPDTYRQCGVDLYRYLRTTSVHNPIMLEKRITLVKSDDHLKMNDPKINLNVSMLIADLEAAVDKRP